MTAIRGLASNASGTRASCEYEDDIMLIAETNDGVRELTESGNRMQKKQD